MSPELRPVYEANIASIVLTAAIQSANLSSLAYRGYHKALSHGRGAVAVPKLPTPRAQYHTRNMASDTFVPAQSHQQLFCALVVLKSLYSKAYRFNRQFLAWGASPAGNVCPKKCNSHTVECLYIYICLLCMPSYRMQTT